MADGKSYGTSYFTPRNILIYLVIGTIVYAAIYFFFLKKDNASLYSYPPSQSSQDANATSMTVSLGAQNDSGESGTATLTEKDGKTTVTLSLSQAPTDVPQPAHIHTGACPTPAGVVYPLTNVVNGASETVLDVSLASLKGQLPLAINVHKSGSEANVYVSCGDLK